MQLTGSSGLTGSHELLPAISPELLPAMSHELLPDPSPELLPAILPGLSPAMLPESLLAVLSKLSAKCNYVQNSGLTPCIHAGAAMKILVQCEDFKSYLVSINWVVRSKHHDTNQSNFLQTLCCWLGICHLKYKKHVKRKKTLASLTFITY